MSILQDDGMSQIHIIIILPQIFYVSLLNIPIQDILLVVGMIRLEIITLPQLFIDQGIHPDFLILIRTAFKHIRSAPSAGDPI